MNAIEQLETCAWKRPEYYSGFSPDGDYLVLTQNRDSPLRNRVNWDVACEMLHAEAYDEGTRYQDSRPPAYHFRAGNDAVGWVEYLLVRADAPDTLKQEAGEIICALAEHPVLNDERYSAAEEAAIAKYWAQASVHQRLDDIKRANRNAPKEWRISLFSARRSELPEDTAGRLNERLVEGL